MDDSHYMEQSSIGTKEQQSITKTNVRICPKYFLTWTLEDSWTTYLMTDDWLWLWLTYSKTLHLISHQEDS